MLHIVKTIIEENKESQFTDSRTKQFLLSKYSKDLDPSLNN